MDTLAKINPLEYISPHDPVPQRILNASRWFVVEVLELDFGDYVGRPSKHAIVRAQLLSYLFSNGWYVDAVQGGGEDGNWQTVSQTDTDNMGTTSSATHSGTKSDTSSATGTNGSTKNKTKGSTTSNGSSQGSSRSNASSQSGASSYSIPFDSETRRALSHGSAVSESSGVTKAHTEESTQTSSNTSSQTSSHTSTKSNTSSETNSATDSATKSTGVSKTSSEGPYWFAYVRLRLKRRKMQAELVMKDMVEDLTKAYNEGRKINDDRYDELVNLYSIMLGRFEDEGNNFIVSTADYQPLTNYVLQTMKKTVADFHAVADNLPDDVFKNRVREINLKFDNQLSKARVELVTAGLFNSTVWTTTASGIERNREMALNDLIETKIDVYVKVTSAAGDIGTRFMDAAAKMQQMAKQRLLDPAETRNQVFKWMLDFMERRKDEFPGLDAIAGAAKSLGYSETTTSNGVK